MRKLLVFLVGVLAACPQAGWAAKAWITDSCETPMRSGPSNRFKIIAMLASGTEVEAVETQEGWTFVKRAQSGGRDGWVPKKSLLERPSWESQARALTDENGGLRERAARAEQAAATASRELDGTSAALRKLQAEHEALRTAAADVAKLKDAHDLALAEGQKLRDRAARLSAENEELQRTFNVRWLLAGVILLTGGWLLGFLMAHIRKKRRSAGLRL